MRLLSLLLPALLLSACSADLTPGQGASRLPFERTGAMVNTDNEWYLEYAENGATLSKILSMTSKTRCTVQGEVQPCIEVTPAEGQAVRVVGETLTDESKLVRATEVDLY